MSKSYVSAVTTNTIKPFSFRFLMAIMILVAVSILLNIATYGIFSTGTQAGWTKPVLAALVAAESYGLYRFWRLIRG